MPASYQNPVYDYIQSDEQRTGRPQQHPVVVVGAGPIGLSAAIDLAQNGVPVVLLDDDNTVSQGSRAICFAKRTLEIFDRLGTGQELVDKGVTWNLGKVFFRNQAVYEFNLLPESDHHRPAFINLQQYYLEEYLIRRLHTLQADAIRWQHKVISVTPRADGVALQVKTPNGVFAMQCEYLLACDGAHSPVRTLLGLDFKGQVFRDRFLIADVVMKGDYPAERWFWFEPHFYGGQSALLHKQPDDVWRIDFQLGHDADPVEERKPENVIPRVKAMLGDDRPFELEWCSVYTFSCLRMERFRHGRIMFAGDAAHTVSPFGARGANGGVQDIDNLIWKLRLVLAGHAPEHLLDSYDSERSYACDENIKNSTRSTDFITPKNTASRMFRDAVLQLAETQPFARALVNSGRLSTPALLADSPLNTPDEVDAGFSDQMKPGTPCTDAPLLHAGQPGWLLAQLGNAFSLLYFCSEAPLSPAENAAITALAQAKPAVHTLLIRPAPGSLATAGNEAIEQLIDHKGLIARRYGARPGSCYLIRPDQHVAARWQAFNADNIRAALARATAQEIMV